MISLCITTYNRTHLLFESFKQVIDDDRISEIVIVDDHSDVRIFDQIASPHRIESSKIKLYRNDKNLGCYRNKREAVSKATNEWVILFDSDNVIGMDYIDTITKLNGGDWHPNVVHQPTFAKPHFNFGAFSGINVHRGNVSKYANDETFLTALNAMNYFVNRDEYLRVWEDRKEPWTADSILHNYNWLKAGNIIYFCPGLEYFHRVDNHGQEEQSHYKEHHRKTGDLYTEVVNKLKELR